jgi:exodeoxyribonuclease V alpha subunit
VSEPSPLMQRWSQSSPEELLAAARSVGILSELDQQFASRLAIFYGETNASVWWALALTSRQESAGHVCADLHRLAKVGLVVETGTESVLYSALAGDDSVEEWLDEIRRSTLIEVLSAETRTEVDPRPLVLDGKGRLYLRRSFQSQEKLAQSVHHRTHRGDLKVDWDLAQAGIARFTEGGDAGDDSARRALATALARPLAIVTGGPGTGKTTMIARLVALLIEQAFAEGRPAPRIRLLAPTGKAAAAMTAAFLVQRGSLDLSDEVRSAMDVSAQTIHRALSPQMRRDDFGRSPDFALAEDIVVVDEASMVDLALMARLFEACRSVGRIVLLGDPSQLASVDSGAVLAELCQPGGVAPDFRSRAESGEAGAELRDSIVSLQTRYRFSESGGIGRLAEAIQSGDADAVIEILDDPASPDVERFEIESVAKVRARLISMSRPVHQQIEAVSAPHEKLERMLLYRVLCAHRRGPLGVEALCSVLDEAAAGARHATGRSEWWPGRMLLVTRNAPDQNLWNGDVGLVERTAGGLRAIFSDGTGGARSWTAGQLPAHESAIAMSVHKSQGSEFDLVDLVLGDVMSRVMTRELLYTGVTRAKSKLRIHTSESVLRAAVARPVSRDSGLAERLWVK